MEKMETTQAPLCVKWSMGELERQDVENWLRTQRESTLLDEEEIKHVTNCLYNIYLWERGKIPSVGGFLTAILHDKFVEATARADGTNSKILSVYAKYMCNVAPGDWRSWVKREEDH